MGVKFRKVDRKWHYGKILIAEACFLKYCSDHRVTLKIGQRVGGGNASVGVSIFFFSQCGIRVGDSYDEVVTARFPGHEILEMVIM